MGVSTSQFEEFGQLVAAMRDQGVTNLYYKLLSPNDNSKNQIYLGSDFSVLQILPFGSITVDENRKDSKRDRFKAVLDFCWIDREGACYSAPESQLILYPKYPEVRFSGFLKGATSRPSDIMTRRDEGRILLMGITAERKIIGHALGRDNNLSGYLRQQSTTLERGVFNRILIGDVLQEPFTRDTKSDDSKSQLLDKLREIHSERWIESVKLDRESGAALPYTAPNGGGYTLEARLGIFPNGDNEPDFMGWEVKQHNVSDLADPLRAGRVTLMTPEPDGGIYQESSVKIFVKRFGYPDTNGTPNRMNFGGVHKLGERHPRTRLTLQLNGFDALSGKISDVNGGLKLLAEDGSEAASWSFPKLLERWNRKHGKAIYIGSHKRKDSVVEYRYGCVVALGEGTDFVKFLQGWSNKKIYYDPGIKVTNIGAALKNEKAKSRNQFRIKAQDIPTLYSSMIICDLRTGTEIPFLS